MARTGTLALITAGLLAGSLSLPSAAHAVASAWQENEQGRVRLITPYRVAPASGELRLGVQFETAPGWHVYWKNSGDAGFPPKIEVLEPPGLAGAELLWPAPRRFELPGDLVAFGYEGEVVYPLRGRLEAAGRDRVRIAADVDYLTCEVDCVPYRYTLALEQPLAAASVPDASTAPLLEGWERAVPAPAGTVPGVAARAALEPGAGGAATLVLAVRGAEPGPGAGLFLEANATYDAGRPELRRVPGGGDFRVPLRARRADAAPAAVPFAWTVTGLSRGGLTLALEARSELAPPALAPDRAPDGAPETRPGALLGGALPAWLPALLATAAFLGALALWGLLGPAASGARREVLGFLCLALALAALYALSRRVSAEGLAAVELALLATGLLSWLKRRSTPRGRLAAALALAAAFTAAAVPWIAHRNRLEVPGDGRSSGPPSATDGRGQEPPAEARTATGG